MIALRVKLNGTLACVAGANDLAVLNAIVGAVGNLGPHTKKKNEPPDVCLTVGGLTRRSEGPDEHLRWAEKSLVTGDKVEIELIETNDTDEPIERKMTEREEEREKLRFEHAKETYFSLRSKFETQ